VRSAAIDALTGELVAFTRAIGAGGTGSGPTPGCRGRRLSRL